MFALSPLLSRFGTKRKPATKHRRRLLFDVLEDRSVPAGFNFADFSDIGGLTLVGDASITGDARLRLTPALGGQEGAAWYTAEKQFAGLSFETSFQFQLTENADPPGGSDGFVFLIQNTAPTYLAGGGGTLGYDGLKNSVAVEFDTYQNTEVRDPSHSHISVHTNGTGTNGWSESLSLGSWNSSPALLDDGAVHTVKIAYTPGSLSIYLDNLTTPKLTVSLDLAETLNLDAGTAWVGFTGTTGGGWQNHDILNWSYTVLADVTTTVSAGDASVDEGSSGTSNLVFTINRSGDISGATTVNWTTENRSATAGSDYIAASGQVSFAPGQTQATVEISVVGDTALEPNETLALRLTGASGASIADGVGIGTILTDDVTVSISDTAVVEGDQTITPLGAFVAAQSGGLYTPYAMLVGQDGSIYVSSRSGTGIYRYDAAGNPMPGPGKTGAEFVSPGSGGLGAARELAFGPDGALCVVSEGTDAVLRFDATTGEFLGTLVASGSGGLDAPRGILFHGGYVYVTSVGEQTVSPGKDSVLRFDAVTGEPAGLSGLPGDAVFIASGSGGLDNPSRIVLGPDGRVYVSSTATTLNSATSNSVLRYDLATSAPAGVSGEPGDAVFVAPGSGGLDGPVSMVFRPDGYMYVTSWRSNSLLRYDAVTGAAAGTVVSSGAGGLEMPIGLLFEANGNLLVSSSHNHQILRYGPGSWAVFTVTLSFPVSFAVSVDFATGNGSAAAGADFVATAGTLTFAPGDTTKTILVETIDDDAPESPEVFVLNLSNPSAGAVITDSQGVATITDNDLPPTKFYVVDDQTANRTFEYGGDGTAIENYTLNSGNSAPRGAASTAAGDKVWVVDANKKVYVYDAAGALLGSWTAGSLAGNATPEGVATNGTDVWIVDSKSDKVFRYAGAAARLSGSQNAVTSFSLNTANKNPKGIVTDGTSLWVVNDASPDKVFKYTLAGGLLGSWTIDAGNSSPTGITLDPTSVGHLWIVDSGTDRVYQYDNAVGRTSGSQAASSGFALAVGNTNPQGIADPPSAGTATTAEKPAQRRKQGPTAARPGIGSHALDWCSAVDAVFGNATTGKRRRR
jgi:hypothetical protein